jgi:hypothetical protein
MLLPVIFDNLPYLCSILLYGYTILFNLSIIFQILFQRVAIENSAKTEYSYSQTFNNISWFFFCGIVF